MTFCKIQKGKHYSSCSTLKFHFNKKSIKFNISFSDDCIYNLESSDQFDINKLFGLSYGLHHKNSARFGWRWNLEKKKFEILAYVYRDGKRINEWEEDILIAEIKPVLIYEMEIIKDNENYIFTVTTTNRKNIYKKTIKCGNECNDFGYHLFPYFGGNQKAPHNMLILLSP